MLCAWNPGWSRWDPQVSQQEMQAGVGTQSRDQSDLPYGATAAPGLPRSTKAFFGLLRRGETFCC
jgi:hypothetical protein